ncbi:hypothetical protein H2200_011827 [Cladophialophora chaetospira]|uniref:Transcription factor domain-containing protein n=1 Tax=Cladophialophora chaetospira TaxID=386627 RepID=A0AA38WYS3_9EURO|nr:hypothetical protein H2200_011827 [Cladophialophora chaetospira]
MSPRKRNNTCKEQEHMRDSLFWTGIIIDSTRSVIHQRPSVILPNREADACVWDLIRQRTVVFEQSFRSLRDSPLPLPADVTVVLLQHAVACKTMNLGMLAQYFGALFQANAGAIEDAAARVLAESRRFHDIFDKFLAMCSRDYFSMSADSRLNYVLLIAHYHLGALVLADTLDHFDVVPEPLKDPSLSRLYACNAIVNALNLALNHDRYSGDDSLLGSTLLRDPTPVVMAEVLSRTGRSIFILLESGQIARHTAQFMITVVAATLSVVSQVSATAKHVLESVRELCARNQLELREDSPTQPRASLSAEHVELLSMCDGAFVDDFLHEMQIQASADGSLDRTIARYETAPNSAAARPVESCRVDALLNEPPGDLWHTNQVFLGR